MEILRGFCGVQLYKRTVVLGYTTRDDETAARGDELLVHTCAIIRSIDEHERL